MTTRTALYMHYGADGDLLYLGVTADPARRLSEHVKAGKWPISEVRVTWYDSREAAEDAERASIRELKPAHNIQHVPTVKPPRIPRPEFASEEVRDLMKKRGWNQTQLGERIGVDQASVSRMLRRGIVKGSAAKLLMQLSQGDDA